MIVPDASAAVLLFGDPAADSHVGDATRANLSPYDAGYVAVAESHDLTFVTADVRIAKAGVARCPIRVIR